jgi:D-tyrosyl-tRNA(Tyr) deacylase
LADVGGSVLAVSNFTVYGETAKNRRPSFVESAPYAEGEKLFDSFVNSLRSTGVDVETGVFGAHMDVSLVNDGPVTVIVDG